MAWTVEADPVYTYDSFLKAAAKMPAFCAEVWHEPIPDDMQDDTDYDGACKREIATLFAHIDKNSENMSQISDPACLYSVDVDRCGYKTAGIDSPSSSLFFSRGPLGL